MNIASTRPVSERKSAWPSSCVCWSAGAVIRCRRVEMPEKELESNIRKISASARQSTAEECCARCCAVERERLVCMICMSAAQRRNICVLQSKVVLGRSRDAETHARGACEAGQEQTGRRWTTAIGERTGEGRVAPGVGGSGCVVLCLAPYHVSLWYITGRPLPLQFLHHPILFRSSSSSKTVPPLLTFPSRT